MAFNNEFCEGFFASRDRMAVSVRQGLTEEEIAEKVAESNPQHGWFGLPRLTEEEIAEEVAEYPALAVKMAEALMIAFGGRCQWGPEEVGHAVAGHHNNNPLVRPELLLKELVDIEVNYWEDYTEEDKVRSYQVAIGAYAGRVCI